MSRSRSRKKTSEVKASDVADTGRAGVTPGPAPVLRVETKEQAIALVKENYKVPEDSKTVYVTEDSNVFWMQNEGSAVNHAQRNNLKIFSLQWD